ncbi:hypothetical protein [Candidatus Anaplasma sp. TIGMIC]|uniref:hypothetical protein n=1 Tax=Candidatus Anaplasma sp. TIGMIC TaxID=3020713 RepID=UPI00232D259E|nr:hypothetical protein [Candidatus Anaplasma sp. TIGMIC]
MDGIAISELKEGTFDYTFVCKPGDRLHLVLSTLPGKVKINGPDELFVRVKKSDIISTTQNMCNPALCACEDEYGASIARYLELEFTNQFADYVTQIYEHFHDGVKNIDGVHGGRFLNHNLDAAARESCEGISLCFPDSRLLEGLVRFAKQDMCYVFKGISDRPTDSILLKAAKMRLQQLRDIGLSNKEGPDSHYDNGVISCFEKFIDTISNADFNPATNLRIKGCDFVVMLREIVGDPAVRCYVEERLYERQVECHVTRLRMDFYEQQKGYYGSLKGEAQPVVTAQDTIEVRDAILGLHRVKRLINNPIFVQKFVGKSGISRAHRRYFKCISSMIEAEIIFLTESIGKLTAGDLRLFLHKTCKNVSDDISHLLAVYDYETTGKTVDRDAVIRVSKSEVKELADQVRSFVYAYNRLWKELQACKSLVDAYAKVTVSTEERRLGVWEKSLYQNISKIFSVDENGQWIANTQSRNSLLLNKVESHKLCDLTHGIRGADDTKLSQVVDGLFDSDVSTDQVFTMLRTYIRNRSHEWIRDIEYSVIPKSVDIAYRISRYLPFHSLWLPLLMPGRYRTRSGYVATSFKDWLFVKKSIIAHTRLTSSIAQSLYLDDFDKRLVAGTGSAAMISTAFKVRCNMSNFREKVAYRIKKIRPIWRISLAVIVTTCVIIGITGRVLGHFGIAGAGTYALMPICQAVFDSLIAVAVLDAAVEQVFLLTINVVCLVVRSLDFVLLCGALSSITEYVCNKLVEIYSAVAEKSCSLYERARKYGVKNLCFLMLERVFYNDNKIGESSLKTRCADHVATESLRQETLTEQSCGAIVSQGLESSEIRSHLTPSGLRNEKGICLSADVITLLSGEYARNQGVFTQALRHSSDTVASELYGEKAGVLRALESFKKTVLLPQSTVFHEDYIRLRREFFFLMNNYPEELKSSITVTVNPSIFNSHNKRRDIYDVVAAVNFNTVLYARNRLKDVPQITSPTAARAFLESAHCVGPGVTIGEISEKIAAIKWAIAQMAAHDISHSVRSTEVLFHDTEIDRSCAIALMDCALVMEDYRDLLLAGRAVSRSVVYCYINSNFRSYIRDTCHILNVIDRAIALRHSSASYRRFCDVMCRDFAMLEDTSHAAVRAHSIMSQNLGVTSGGAKATEKFMEVFGYQHLRSFTLSFIAYKSLWYLFGEYVHYVGSYSKLADMALTHAGISPAYEFFMSTECGTKFLEFFWTHVSPKDAAMFTREIVMSMMVFDEDSVSDVSHAVDQYLYTSSFHSHMHAVKGMRSLLNHVADLCCTVLQLHLARKIISERKRELPVESLEFFLQLEKECVNEKSGLKGYNETSCCSNIEVLHCTEVFHGITGLMPEVLSR